MSTQVTDTETVLDNMFTENTGRSILDSGAAYGRHWERNQETEAYKQDPAVELSVWGEDVTGVISTYHFLKRHADFEPELQRWFDEMANVRPDDTWSDLLDGFPQYVYENYDAQLRDPDDIGSPPFSANTYNNPNCRLSQELQCTFFSVLTEDGKFGETEDYALIRLHNGCDVRGGYTKPRAFRLIGGLPGFLIRSGEFTVSDGEYYWDFDGQGWIGAHPEAKRFDQYSAASAAQVLGFREERGFPDAGKAYEQIRTWERKASENMNRLSEKHIQDHEENVRKLQDKWFGALQSHASNGVIVYFDDIEPPEFVEYEQPVLILSPETGDPITAYI